MTEWKDPQQRAEEEDRERGYDALAVDDGADTREKLEADVRKRYTHTVSTAMWPPSANKHTDMVSVSIDTVLGWLDRQEAITEREHPGLTISDDESLVNWHGKNYLLQSRVLNAERERDEFSLKLKHEMELNRDNRNALDLERIAELEAELDRANESGGKLFDRLVDMTAERDSLLEQLNRVWLKDADGNPLHIGETRYGEDGTGWRVTGFRWGSSHPVQGVDATGRRRDLKPEWLRSEQPDSWERVRSEIGCLIENLSMYGSKYAGDPDAELDAILERARGLAGGSE